MRWWIKIFLSFVGTGILFGLIGVGVIFYFGLGLPEVDGLKDYRPALTTSILSADGEVLLATAKEKRTLAEIEDIPPAVINAFLAAEDDNFYEHSGVDYLGIFRAALINIKAGGLVQGGSTITQQVAKSLLLTRERTISRKIKDFLLAQRIEEKFSKEEILYLYLNQVYLGAGYYGVKAAFEGYFGKKLSDVSPAESALVAGLLVAPGKYSPYINPGLAKMRQKYVLGRMFETGQIDKDEHNHAVNQVIELRPRRAEELKAPFFVDWVRQKVIAAMGKDVFLTEGLQIKTSLNWKLQKKAEKAVREGIKSIDKRQGFKGAISSLDTANQKLEFLKSQRRKLIKQASSFVRFTPEGKLVYELDDSGTYFDEDYSVEEKKLGAISKKWRVFAEVGNIELSELAKHLRPTVKYKCLVSKVSNSQRIIYGSIGGIRVVIPEESFSWAHERYTAKEPRYFGAIKNPESVVSKGDVVWVEVSGESSSAWDLIASDFKRRKDLPEELVEFLRTEKFMTAELTQIPEVEAALLALRPRSGEIISMVGGHNFEKSQFNRAVQSLRQPGSSFKPLIYAAALENGFHPASILQDSPQAMGGSTDFLNWKPRNYDGTFKGPMTLRKALEVSRNIPTIKLVQDIGVQEFESFIHRLQIPVKMPQDLSISLGSFGISLKDLVAAYAIFPSLGRQVTPKGIISIEDKNGEPVDLEKSESELKLEGPPNAISDNSSSEVFENDESESLSLKENKNERYHKEFRRKLSAHQVYDPRLSYIMVNLLKGVISNGTGRKAKSLSSHIGGKTGTTNDFLDAWFVGFGANVVAGVWTGMDDNQSMGHAETGSRAALPIWKEYMELALEEMGNYDIFEPKGMTNILIDRKTGRKLANSSGNAFLETFVEGFGPFSSTNSENLTTRQSVLDDEGFFYQQ